MNGELRIGFFAKRPISLNEELTFDYQFQKLGKVQQKCYCGSEKCRGFLGVSTSTSAQEEESGGAFDHIWNETSDESNSSSSSDDNEEEKFKTSAEKDHKKKTNKEDFEVNFVFL